MKLSTSVKFEQKQKLIMTQELRQSINILAYDNLDLLDYINKELEENPILEVDRTNEDGENMDYLTNNSWDFNLDGYSAGNEISLLDYLEEQISYLDLSEDLRAICIYIVGNIDNRGYLDIDEEDFFEKTGLDRKRYYESLEIVQSLEPVGIGARNLQESFKIQLQRSGRLDEKYRELIDYYLLELPELGWEKTSCKLDISIGRLEKMIRVLSHLQAYPARNYKLDSQVNYTKPDIIITRRGKDFKIDLYDDFIPNIYINPYYKKVLENSRDSEEIKYIKEKIEAANWLIRSIESRRNTIIKVVVSILEHQYNFFHKKIDYLLPLRLKDVAQDIAMHESTVSRVVKDKYLAMDEGIYNLSYFFNSSLKTKKGSISSYDVKNIIKSIVDNEDENSPYSDQEIKDILYRDMGIRISRRTVAKYRSELSLASSYGRKKLRRLEKI